MTGRSCSSRPSPEPTTVANRHTPLRGQELGEPACRVGRQRLARTDLPTRSEAHPRDGRIGAAAALTSVPTRDEPPRLRRPFPDVSPAVRRHEAGPDHDSSCHSDCCKSRSRPSIVPSRRVRRLAEACASLANRPQSAGPSRIRYCATRRHMTGRASMDTESACSGRKKSPTAVTCLIRDERTSRIRAWEGE